MVWSWENSTGYQWAPNYLCILLESPNGRTPNLYADPPAQGHGGVMLGVLLWEAGRGHVTLHQEMESVSHQRT